jgi:hypothetical protein
MSITYHTIPKGTILYRAAPTTELSGRLCKETGKTGVYFSTYTLQSLSMCLEYQKEMKLGVFETTKEIVCINGKYSHFKMEPIKKEKIKIWKFNLPIVRKVFYQSVNHFDKDVFCIIDSKYSYLTNFKKDSLGLKTTDGEVFISDSNDLESIILKEEYNIRLEGLLDVIKKNNYTPNSEEYFKDR